MAKLTTQQIQKFTLLKSKKSENNHPIGINYVKETTGKPTGTGAQYELCLNTFDKKLYIFYPDRCVEINDNLQRIKEGKIYVHAHNGVNTTTAGSYEATDIAYVAGAIAGGSKEVTQITLIADVSDSLDGKYFKLGSTHFVWYNTSGGSATAPTLGGLYTNAIVVAITTGSTAAVVAAATAAAIDADASYVSSLLHDSVIEVTEAATGIATDVVNVDIPSGFAASITQQGSNDFVTYKVF
jgi:hypothetical protein